MQGYTGVAAVDAKHQIVVAAQAHDTGAERAGKTMAPLTQRDCDAIARKLNTRPRKRLGYTTPEQC